MKRYKGFNIKKTGVRTIMFGIAFSFLSLIISSFLISLMLSGMSDPIRYIGIASLIAFLISGAVSGLATAKYKGQGGVKSALISSLIFIAIIFLISLVISKGSVSGGIFMNYVCYIMLSLLTAALSSREKKHRRRR